jgi:hypothetical protein
MNQIDTTIPRFLDRRPMTWTYTMLQTYLDICAHQAFRRYMLKKGDPGHIPYVETKEMRWGNEVHTAMEYRLLGGKPLPEPMHTFEKFAVPFDGRKPICEPKLAINRDWKIVDYFAKDVWGRNRCDVALIQGDKAYLLDWKTGKPRENPFELEIQAVFLRLKYPQVRTIMGQFCWLKEDRMGPLHDLSDVQATCRKIVETIRMIEADQAAGEFDKEPSPLCGWCDVMDCEHNKKPEATA